MILRTGFTVGCIGLAASLGAAAAWAAPSPPVYRAEMNAMCRTTTVKLHTVEAELASAKKANDRVAYAVALGEYLGLGLREDATIEAAPLPAALRPTMEPVLNRLKRIDGYVRAAIKSMAAGNGASAQADMAEVAVLGRPINRSMDKAGLRDCGSNQN